MSYNETRAGFEENALTDGFQNETKKQGNPRYCFFLSGGYRAEFNIRGTSRMFLGGI